MQIISYNCKIIINTDLASSFSTAYSGVEPEKIFIIVDSNTYQYCLEQITPLIQQNHIFVLTIKQGEANKSLQTVEEIWSFLQKNKCRREDLVINLGGGMLLDIGGFAAATYSRGVRFMHIPTTLLAMVDASIGGKLGFNFGGIKNQLGLFQSPEAVLIHPAFLKTLDHRQLLAGWAEMIKHGLIHSEQHLEAMLNRTPYDTEWKVWEQLIYDSLQIKNYYVDQDPKESGLRKILNFGHTVGHAFESLAMQKNESLLHGEAVANGMFCEIYLSEKKASFPKELAKRIRTYILKHYKTMKLTDEDICSLWQYMQMDKKNSANQVQCVLLEGVGAPLPVVTIREDDFRESLAFYRAQVRGIE